MKICMLSTGHSPYDDRIYYKEVLTLARRYKSIVLVMPGEQSDFKITNPGITFVALRKSSSILSRFLVIPQAIITILKIRPQICHFHDYELIFALPFLRLFSRCKIIYDVHELYPEMIQGSKKVPVLLRPFLAKLVDFSEKILSNLADCIITSDENISESFKNKCVNLSTIFNYPRLSMFKPDEKTVSQLKKLYKNRTPIIYVGSMSKERGLFHMIKAMEIIKDKRSDAILLLLGKLSESLYEKATRMIKKKSLQRYIEFLGWVPHNKVVNYISISKIGLVPLLPTRKYMKNVNIKQFEYMACGVPVLGANLPPIAFYINSSNCGKLFDSTNVETLASGVVDILQNESEWKRMSEAGKKAVRDLWNWNQMENKLFTVYEDLLQP